MKIEIDFEGMLKQAIANALAPEAIQPVIQQKMNEVVASAINEQFRHERDRIRELVGSEREALMRIGFAASHASPCRCERWREIKFKARAMRARASIERVINRHSSEWQCTVRLIMNPPSPPSRNSFRAAAALRAMPRTFDEFPTPDELEREVLELIKMLEKAG